MVDPPETTSRTRKNDGEDRRLSSGTQEVAPASVLSEQVSQQSKDAGLHDLHDKGEPRPSILRNRNHHGQFYRLRTVSTGVL